MSLARKHKAPVLGPAAKSQLCPFCSARFSRSDTARRHSTTCPQKRGRPIPLPLKRGRRRKACDFCAASKNGCDGEPGQCCSACLCRSQPCTYSLNIPGRSTEEALDSTESVAGSVTEAAFSTPATSHADSPGDLPEASSSTPYKRIPISFLLQFTDPRNRSIQQHFPTTVKSKDTPETTGSQKAPESSTAIDASHDANTIYTPGYRTDVFTHDPSDPWAWPCDGIGIGMNMGMGMGMGIGEAGPFDSILDRDFMFSRTWGVATEDTHALPEQGHPELYDSLDATLLQDAEVCPVIAQRMDEILSELGQKSTALDLSQAKVIFNATRVDALLQAYFESWHPHCPILHRPSFDAATVFLPLLVAMLMIGATYLSKESDEAARACLGIVEVYIFEHPSFQQLLDPDDNTEKNIHPLQAAFAISVLLNWHDHHGSQRRVRLHRYTDLVAAARNLGLPSLQRANLTKPASPPEWTAFFSTEEAIRLMGYLFLVDSSHVIFHRMPPKLTLSEMTGSLPCSPRLFALASDAPELDDAWRVSFSSPKVASVSRAMSLFMHDKAKSGNTLEDDLKLFGHLDCQDLFILVSGLHEIIFTSGVSCSLEAVKPALQHALARWKCLWDWYQGDDAEQEAQQAYTGGGFYENAIEYFWLAHLFLDNDGAPVTAAERHLRQADQDSMEEINSFMKRFAEIRLV